MRTLFFTLFLLPFAVLGDQVTISLAASPQEAVAAIKKLGAVDITSQIGTKFGAPQKATFWELADYGTFILLIERDGKLASMSYWAKQDFTPKDRRAKTQQRIKTFSANPETKRISIEKVE